ncbi:YqiA/YcfP family alpha/beta fold hydrolase, partial [Fluviicola sp.]|uniref:YqiA/YcfP family alpha/beta fold hydrolase n=1 Tax=Fluviicola sp. TaxID=1917219 RepID=UPI00262C0D10
YRNYDEAGLVEISEYDFKGNILDTKRQCVSDAELLSVFSPPPIDWNVSCYRVDWAGFPSILDTKTFETNFEYDALNRLKKVTYPEDANNIRKDLLPSYNRAGALKGVTFDGTDYVKQIAYNAKGQRLLIAYGNDIMTRYVYDNRTSRLSRLKSEKYLQSSWEFIPQSGTTKQDLAYTSDLIGNILTITDKSPDCGVGGTSSLTRSFGYDPLYRLIAASGRENNPGTPFPWWDDVYRSTDNSITTSYTQHYNYDKVGNIQSLQHIGENLFTRNFDYSVSNNRLHSITVGLNSCNYLYDNSGNQIQENSSRFFQWDFSNQMRCFYNQAGTAEPTIYAQYLYDGSGNRVKKIVRTQGGDYESISYIGGTFEYKTNGLDVQTTTHIMDANSRIVMIREGDVFGDMTPSVKYNLEDHLGSSTILLETNGFSINKEEYYPFGETSFGSYSKKRYRYSGKEKDEESGLYYYGARYYMPWACKFVSCDPLTGKLPQWSSYAAFNDNPIVYIDPIGLEGEPPPITGNEKEGDGSKDGNFVFYNGEWHTGSSDSAVVTPDKGPSVLEAAKMELKSYDDKLKSGDSKELSGGWKVADNIPGVELEKREIGFESTLYSRTINGRTEYVYALRGTDEKIDWNHNLSQAFGTSEQYELAISNSQKIIEKFGLGKVTIVGHSLGGGLATAAALKTGADAIVFNPAWVSDLTISQMGLNRDNYINVKSFVVAGEVLDKSQASAKYIIGQLNRIVRLNRPPNTTVLGEHNGTAYAVGMIISIKEIDSGVNFPVMLHSMDSVIKALKAKGIK